MQDDQHKYACQESIDNNQMSNCKVFIKRIWLTLLLNYYFAIKYYFLEMH